VINVRTFILGYREQEETVTTKLIGPLAQRSGVTRIGPNLEVVPPDSLKDDAASAMKKLAASLEAV
jgi:hypothetical protein